MPKKGKKYRESLTKLEKEFYSIQEAVKLLKDASSVKFDETAEAHINLNIDPKKADQSIRGTIALPHGSGKKLKIAVVCTDDKIKIAKAAGAVNAGLEDLIAEFEKGKFDYDVVVATTDVMKNLAKVAKTLGQKGLMPNPKSGTVTDNIEKTVKELAGGRIEYRNDKQGIVHAVFGKVSFKEEELENNLKALLKVIKDSKPSSIKGTFFKTISVSSTMGPGIAIEATEALKSL